MSLLEPDKIDEIEAESNKDRMQTLGTLIICGIIGTFYGLVTAKSRSGGFAGALGTAFGLIIFCNSDVHFYKIF